MSVPVVPAARVHDWQVRLARLFDERLRLPFHWGLHDCALWAADAVHACTGVDVAADLRGTYGTELQAARVLAAHGGLAELCIARLGPVVPVGLAQPGDVVLALVEGRESLAVCGGAHVHGPARDGLTVLDAGALRRAWRITREVPHG